MFNFVFFSSRNHSILGFLQRYIERYYFCYFCQSCLGDFCKKKNNIAKSNIVSKLCYLNLRIILRNIIKRTKWFASEHQYRLESGDSIQKIEENSICNFFRALPKPKFWYLGIPIPNP